MLELSRLNCTCQNTPGISFSSVVDCAASWLLARFKPATGPRPAICRNMLSKLPAAEHIPADSLIPGELQSGIHLRAGHPVHALSCCRCWWRLGSVIFKPSDLLLATCFASEM